MSTPLKKFNILQFNSHGAGGADNISTVPLIFQFILAINDIPTYTFVDNTTFSFDDIPIYKKLKLTVSPIPMSMEGKTTAAPAKKSDKSRVLIVIFQEI